jgi:predicted RNase H-like HicB family nuclease
VTEAERIKELEEELEALRKSKEIIINPVVPAELRTLTEQAAVALKIHTGEGKAILLTELRKRYDAAIRELRDNGFDVAIPDEKIAKLMGNTFGKGLAELVIQEWAKAVKEEKELEGLPEKIKEIGQEKAVKNMALVVGQDAARTVFTQIFNKAFFEGCALMVALFGKFKDDVLIANE